jgi:hypothetical protein
MPRLQTKTREEKCGTTTGYAQGCRCERCRAAWATYYRERYARMAAMASPAGRERLAEIERRAERQRAIEALL